MALLCEGTFCHTLSRKAHSGLRETRHGSEAAPPGGSYDRNWVMC